MANLARTSGLPARILLATDLSTGSERALERAVWLATSWQARLTILHVFRESPDPASLTAQAHALPSWQRPPDAVSIAKQRIRQGLHTDVGAAVEKASVLVEEGEPAEVIERVAIAEGSELVVTGIAHESPFANQPVILGKTLERLLRRSPAPILIVRNRVRASYEHILVATDFSDVSRHALQAALRFFPLRRLRLLHAFEAPYTGLVSEPAAYNRSYGEARARDLEGFLDSIFLSSDLRSRIDPLIEYGRAAQLISQYVRDHSADLVVLGTHGRGAVLESLIGSTAKNILATLTCDALVVRGPRAGTR